VEPREIKARLDSPVVQGVMKMGYSRDIIRKVIERRLVSTGKSQSLSYLGTCDWPLFKLNFLT